MGWSGAVKLNEIVKSKDEELNQASMESMDEINTYQHHRQYPQGSQ